MKWNDAYRTGIPEIDAQHRQLFRMSEDFMECVLEGCDEQGYRLFLHSLRLYSTAHFGVEEACMLRHRCPFHDVNRRGHTVFLESVDGLSARLERDGYRPADARDAVEMVDRWLHEHIGRIDVQLRPLVEGDAA